MKYLYALDVSMTNTGVAIFEYPSGKLVHKCSISPKVDKNGNKNDYDGERLWFHYNKINELISKFKPEIVVVERGFTRFNNVTQTLFKVHGVYQMAFHGIDYIYLTPMSIKKTIYKGNANKEEIRKMIVDKFNIDFDDYDQSDAYSIGLSYLIDNCNFPWECSEELTLKDLEKLVKESNKNNLSTEDVELMKNKIKEKKQDMKDFEKYIKQKERG